MTLQMHLLLLLAEDLIDHLEGNDGFSHGAYGIGTPAYHTRHERVTELRWMVEELKKLGSA